MAIISSIIAAVVAVVTSKLFIFAAIAVAGAVISMFTAPKPPKISLGYQGDIGSSPRYGAFGPLDNTVSNELAVPVLYGQLKLAGNVIWQTDPDMTVARVVGLCEGEINAITDIRANDISINGSDAPGSSFTVYLGTPLQKADSRVASIIRDNMNLRNLAYIALTLAVSAKIQGGNPTITSVVQGLKVSIWQGGVWTTVKSYSRNPAACIRDFILSNRYGLGISSSNIDDQSFGDVYDYCEERVEGGGASGAVPGTVTLLHADGPNGSTNFYDSSITANKTVVAGGGVQISTAQSKFGGASALFNGTDAYLEIGPHVDFEFGNSDFTIEFWVFMNVVDANTQVFYSMGRQDNRTAIYWDGTYFTFQVSRGGVTRVQLFSTTVPSSGQWYHLRGVRGGTVFRFFVNGAQEGGDGDWDGVTTDNPSTLYLGKQNPSHTPFYFNGYIDEFRLVKGQALSMTTFDPEDQTEHRYRLDYIIDAQKPAQDVLNDMLATFTGFIVYSGSKVKLRVEKPETITQYFGDGSTTDQNATFDPSNIIKDSFSWNMSGLDDRPNRIRIQWVDPNQNYVKIFTQVEDRADQDDRNAVIPKDISLLGITRQSQSLRMAKLHMAVAKFVSLSISFSVRLESIHCEVGDVVAVTHQAALFTRRFFRITSMQESEDETIRITCKEYNATIYDDHQATAIVSYVQPSGPSPYAPLSDVTNLTLVEDSFLNEDGTYVVNILTSWTPPPADQLMRLDRYLIQISSDGGANYRDVAFANNLATSYRIVMGNMQTGLTFVVRVKTINDRGVESPGATSSILIQGKNRPPSDVEDFSVNYAGDHIAMSWSAINDVDLFGYEIRVGNENAIWETAFIVATEVLSNTYNLFAFTTGIKKYFVKAIDNSGNYSENAAVDSITIASIAGMNDYFTFDLWSRVSELPHPLQGTLSSDLDRIPMPDFDPTYYRLTFQPKTLKNWSEYQADAITWQTLQNGLGFVFGQEEYETAQQSWQTESIDIGGVVTAQHILDLQSFSYTNLGFIAVEMATSNDNVTFTSFAPYTPGNVNARYVKFKFLIQATAVSNQNDTVIRLISAKLKVQAPDMTQNFLNQAISSGGATIYLTGFITVKSIVITTVGSSNLTPRITSQSNLPNSFDMILFDTSGVQQSGNVNIVVNGF